VSSISAINERIRSRPSGSAVAWAATPTSGILRVRTNAIAAARYRDGAFGWGVSTPGHGLVFARAGRPLDAAAASPLSGAGKYGPLLLLDDPAQLAQTLQSYFLDILPGFSSDPVAGVYNHGWMIGSTKGISVALQARIDSLLEIVPVRTPDAPPEP